MGARPLDARQPRRPDRVPASMAGGAAASGVRLAGRGGLLRQDELVGPGDPEPVFLLPVADDHFLSVTEERCAPDGYHPTGRGRRSLVGLAKCDDKCGSHARYSAMILPLAVLWLKSPTKLYVPFLSAGIRRRRALPAGITFSMRRSWLSNSSGVASLLVMTRTNDVPAVTVIASGVKRWFSMVSGISGGSADRAGVPPAMTERIRAPTSTPRRSMVAPLWRRSRDRMRVPQGLGSPNILA